MGNLLSACSALVLLTSPLFAATISGFVWEKGSRESMPYVSVYVEDLRIGAMTNTSGYYVINGVPPGQFTLVASLIGYNDNREKVTVGTEPVIQNVELEPAAIELQAVQVTAERVKSPSLEIIPSRETLRGTDLKIAPAAVEADPIRTLQTLPGVVQLSDFNTGLYVRGGTPDQNLILVDGAELYNVSHFFGLFSTFPADAIKSAELLTGGYPAQYDGRLSSVLNVTTDEGNKERLRGSGGVSLLSSRLTLQGPTGRSGSYLISGRRTYLEPVLALAGLDELDYSFYDMQGKIHQIVSQNDQFAIAGYLGNDNFAYKSTGNLIDSQLQWGNWSISAMWNHLFSSTLLSRYQFTLSRFKSNLKFKIEDFGATDRNRLFDVDAHADLTWFASPEHTVETGLHLKRHQMAYGGAFGNQEYNAFDIAAYVPAAYAQDSWHPWPFLTMQPGLHVSYFTGRDRLYGTSQRSSYTDFDPRFSTRFQVGENTFLKVAVGRYTQYIFRAAREIQGISFMSDLWWTCDSTAPPQHAWHYVVGVETKLRDDVDLTVEWYYKDYDQIAEFNFEAASKPVGSAGEALVRGEGYAYGMDVNLKKRAGRHTGWISYAASWTVRDIENLNTEDEGKHHPYYPKYDSRHHIDAVYSFTITRRWTLNSRFSFGTGQGYTRILGYTPIEDPVYRLDPIYREGLNADRLPYYMRLDVGIRGQFRKWRVKWMPFLQIVNVLNRRNEFNHYRTPGDNTVNPPKPSEEKTIPQLPFLPTIGLDVEF